MVVKPDTVARLERLAAFTPAILLVFAVLAWALRTDAAVRTLQGHDSAYQTESVTGADRLARLEQGQRDETQRLDRIETKVDTVLERVK